MFIIQSLVLCELLGLFVHWNIGGLHPFSPAFKLTLSHGGGGGGVEVSYGAFSLCAWYDSSPFIILSFTLVTIGKEQDHGRACLWMCAPYDFGYCLVIL